MITKSKKHTRLKKRFSIRKKIKGSKECPRLSVYRSNKEIYAQLINDEDGFTIASASSLDKSFEKPMKKVDQAKLVGKIIAENAKQVGIKNVVFDRGGFLYHGRIKALAESAREGGLNF